MSAAEIDEYLGTASTLRLASVGANGGPHISPLWFVWDGANIWLTSVVKSQRWVNLLRDPRVAAVIDGGDDFMSLHGVEVIGRVEPVGDVPRLNNPDERVAEPERLFGDKYGGGKYVSDERHAWLKLIPEKIVSWDYRKMSKG
ncbi:MAG TPA: pyridoxamine 5'-phosphate oxidase family protein [Jatrophihabitans sp.]